MVSPTTVYSHVKSVLRKLDVHSRPDADVIRDALGHTSLAVTDRYLRDVAPTHVIDTMRARRWES